VRHGWDRQRDFPPPAQEAFARRAYLNAGVGQDPQLAREGHGFAQAGYVVLDTQLIRPGRHIASGLLAHAGCAIPQLGDLVSSGRHGAVAKSIRDEMRA
jgi:hypothetical protein